MKQGDLFFTKVTRTSPDKSYVEYKYKKPLMAVCLDTQIPDGDIGLKEIQMRFAEMGYVSFGELDNIFKKGATKKALDYIQNEFKDVK